ncbi:hypothetical protein [Streptomyces sp. Ag109_O5-1]|uniref:hypothetical protein n=1 Tax=Streptomyces sp. Ag109_O5-1 TaxID=1938851 RepID=UPI00162762D9|nr:hypothetical protein [Streptomyces sp. Ag109_O5-1]
MTGAELTLGAVLVRLEEQEREISAQADATREQITQLTARLDELGRAAEEVRITRKTLLTLPDPQPPAAPAPELPDHPAYQQIMAGVHRRRRAAAGAAGVRGDGPGDRAQQHQQHPPETQTAGRAQNPGRDRAGLVHPAAAVAARRHRSQRVHPSRNSETDINSRTAL